MPKGRLRVRLKSYDSRVLDDSAEEILDTAIRTGAKIAGPIPLPTEKEMITVTTSPHVDKDAREQLEMIQTFDEHGRVKAVTKIQVSPNYVVQIKQTDKDGYISAQLGSEKRKKATKPLVGHTKKADLDFVPKYLREVEFSGELKVGQETS